MEPLKWIGYVVAAILVLSVVIGIGLLVVAIVTIGGAIFTAVTLVGILAAQLRAHFELNRRRRG